MKLKKDVRTIHPRPRHLNLATIRNAPNDMQSEISYNTTSLVVRACHTQLIYAI